jgi:hypothetical protein
MFENAVRACPDELRSERPRRLEFWWVVYHTISWPREVPGAARF